MRRIATFYTLFWIVYFPTCIAFYKDYGVMSYIDEFMTLILILYTFSKARAKSVNRLPWKEYNMFLMVLVFYLIYSLILQVNVPLAAIRDVVQWVRPFSVIYCTWILNPRFSTKQKRWMLASMIATLIFWVVTNRTTFEKENAEFVVLGQMAMCTGMAWYLFTDYKRENLYVATFLVITGMLAPKFKYLGEVVCFIYIMYFLKQKLNFKSPKTVAIFAMIVAVILYITWFKFEVYYVTGMSGNVERMARPESFKVAFGKIIWEYFPFGPGFGTFGVAAVVKYYSPLYYKYNLHTIWGLSPDWPAFLADAFYPTLAQFGVVGIGLFIAFWKKRITQLNRIVDMRYYRVAFIAVACLAIEQTADSSFLSGKGMGFCMLIGLCLNANRNLMAQQEKIRREQERLAREKDVYEELQEKQK